MFHRQFLPYVTNIGTPGFRRWAMEHFPFSLVRLAVKLVDNTQAHAVRIFEEKKKALQEGDAAVEKQVGSGKDIMSILRE